MPSERVLTTRFGNVTLFLSCILTSLTTGRAFWAWLGEGPSDFSAAAFVEYYQVLADKITIPIALMGAGGIATASISAFLLRRDRPVLYLLLIAIVMSVSAALVTVIVHLPINAELAVWDLANLPSNYLDTLQRWRAWNTVRLILLSIAMVSIFGSMLMRR